MASVCTSVVHGAVIYGVGLVISANQCMRDSNSNRNDYDCFVRSLKLIRTCIVHT